MKQYAGLRVVMLICNILDVEAPATGSRPTIIGHGGLTRTPIVVEQNVVPRLRHASVRQPPRRSPRIAVVENSTPESAGTGCPCPRACVAATAAHPIHAAVEQTKASGGCPAVVGKTAALCATPPRNHPQVVSTRALESAGTGRPRVVVDLDAVDPIPAAVEQTKASGGCPTIVAKTDALCPPRTRAQVQRVAGLEPAHGLDSAST